MLQWHIQDRFQSQCTVETVPSDFGVLFCIIELRDQIWPDLRSTVTRFVRFCCRHWKLLNHAVAFPPLSPSRMYVSWCANVLRHVCLILVSDSELYASDWNRLEKKYRSDAAWESISSSPQPHSCQPRYCWQMQCCTDTAIHRSLLLYDDSCYVPFQQRQNALAILKNFLLFFTPLSWGGK